MVALSFFLYKDISAQGIIIADKKQEALFASTNENDILNFASIISHSYKEVILHLGLSHVFKDGNMYSTKTSQKNLLLFCQELKKKDVKVFLWFMDSYGAKNFNSIYQDHHNIIDDNISTINHLQIPYDGVAVDLEWINKGGSKNNNRFLEILKYLRGKIGDKKLYCFASLVNNESTNSSRGYDTPQILEVADNIIAMLYLQDSDFFILSENKKPVLNIKRVESLRNYFGQMNWLLAVSLEDVILTENERTGKLNLLPEFEEGYDKLLSRSKIKNTSKDELSEEFEYKIKKRGNYKIKNDGKMHLHKRQKFYYFKLDTAALPTQNGFIWEYFLLNKTEQLPNQN